MLQCHVRAIVFIDTKLIINFLLQIYQEQDTELTEKHEFSNLSNIKQIHNCYMCITLVLTLF
jgi:hypothetical protein